MAVSSLVLKLIELDLHHNRQEGSLIASFLARHGNFSYPKEVEYNHILQLY